MRLGPLADEKPNLKRLREIISVLAKYEFGNVLEKTGLKGRIRIPFISSKEDKELDNTAPLRFRKALEELGTTFIKLGQVLSSRPDLVGKDIADELVKLQDEVPPFSFEEVQIIIEEELGKPLNELFTEFDKNPLASASVAQVHQARLKDGTNVAVKVQRPDIQERIEQDIVIMRYLARQANKRLPDLVYYNLEGIVDEFQRTIHKELDFSQEARNAERFRMLFEDDPHVYAPLVYRDYSTRRILTMEFIDGIKISDVLEAEKKINGKVIADIGTRCYFKQIFDFGFFHADPHPGNLLVMKDNVLCFVDFGMMGHLEQEFMENLAELFVYMVQYDIQGMISQLKYMRLMEDVDDENELKYILIDLLDKYYGAEIQDVGGMISEMSMPQIMVRYKIKLPRDFVLLGRVLSLAEDIGRRLDPEFNGIEAAEHYIRRLIKKRFNPLRLLDYQTRYLFETEHLVRDLPGAVNQAFLRLGEGKLKMEIKHKELPEFTEHLERITNRVVFALIVSSLIIGSSLILQTNKGMPMPGIGFSTVGIVIFLIAAVLALIISIIILRTRRI